MMKKCYIKRERNQRKNLSSPFVRKSNLSVINIFGRKFLKNRSGWKTLSKLQRPETGRTSAWELRRFSFRLSALFFKPCFIIGYIKRSIQSKGLELLWCFLPIPFLVKKSEIGESWVERNKVEIKPCHSAAVRFHRSNFRRRTTIFLLKKF